MTLIAKKKKKKKKAAAVGFKPTPPQKLMPLTSALDQSATLPYAYHAGFRAMQISF